MATTSTVSGQWADSTTAPLSNMWTHKQMSAIGETLRYNNWWGNRGRRTGRTAERVWSFWHDKSGTDGELKQDHADPLQLCISAPLCIFKCNRTQRTSRRKAVIWLFQGVSVNFHTLSHVGWDFFIKTAVMYFHSKASIFQGWTQKLRKKRENVIQSHCGSFSSVFVRFHLIYFDI